jgi:hypothetical protein
VCKGVRLGKQALLLGDTELAPGALLKARIGGNLVGISHLFTP